MKITAIAVTALVVAIVAAALALVAYDRTESALKSPVDSSLNQTGADPAEGQEAGLPDENGSMNTNTTTVPQSQP